MALRRRALALAALVLVAGGCREGTGGRPGGTQPQAAETTLHAFNVHLDAKGEPGSDRLLVAVHAAEPTVRVRLTGGIPAPNRSLRVCPLVNLDRPVDPRSCPTPAPGATTPVRLDGGVGVAVVQTGDDPGRPAVDAGEITFSYRARDRSVSLVLPNLIPPEGPEICKDNGCNPFFEMTPRRAGRFTASATWPDVATGTLSMETGPIAARGLTTSGIPYTVVASTQGSSEEGPPRPRIEGTLDGSSEAALALRNTGARLLARARVDATWP